jgi:hypothetical protein
MLATGDATAVCNVIAAPPVDGLAQATGTWPFKLLLMPTLVGASGTVDGVALNDALEAAPVPDTFVAVTVNV